VYVLHLGAHQAEMVHKVSVNYIGFKNAKTPGRRSRGFLFLLSVLRPSVPHNPFAFPPTIP
jgi:hypothetical protein